MQSDGKLLSSTQQQQNSRALRQSFSCLVDAMRFAYHKEQLDQRILEIEERSAKSVSDLQDLNGKLENLVQTAGDEFDRETITELSAQITGFAHLAIEQAKAKIESKNKLELSEFQSSRDSEITKTRKSIEAFVSTSPFTILDKVLNLRLLDGAYEARGIYRCAENIQYEFSYDTKKSRTFSKEFRLSTFEREFRVPISVGKTWLRRDQVPDYERIDQYALVSAESSETNLIVVFKHAEKDSQLKVVYSKHDSHSSLSIAYSDGQRSVDITSTPSLNRFLDSEPLERTMERLWLSLIDLENYKVGLTKLVSEDVSILENLDCFEFFAKSWKIIAPRIIQEMKSSKDDAESEDRLTVPYVLERVGMLGENADSILEILELKKI
ncbi:MAG: hypothetical protein OK457_01235 [Thaumarchaeota archaeon]|nr:hypothetical protein [Nitrososphaerota archaeon]